MSIDDSAESFRLYKDTYLKDRQLMTLSDYLNTFMHRNPQLSISIIIRDANLSQSNTYQVFNGRRKHPDKYKLVAICMAMEMSPEETNFALHLAEQALLSPENELDAALIICLRYKYHYMKRVNEYLEKVDLTLID